MTGPYIVIAVGVVLVFIAVVLDLCERRVRQVQRSLQAEIERLRDALNVYVGAIDERDRYRDAIQRHHDKVQGNPNNSAYQGQADRELWAALDGASACNCGNCVGVLHASDCAVHNEPAYPAGPCDCGVE